MVCPINWALSHHTIIKGTPMSSWGSRNRGVGRDGNQALTSGRIGPTGLRSFHCKLTPLKGSGRGRIAYIHGLDESREDIVITDGKSVEEIEKVAARADRSEEKARALDGVELPGASAYTNIVELPRVAADLTPADLVEMCDAIAGELVAASRRNRLERIPTTWAVHRAGKNDNMHLHIVALVDQGLTGRPRLIDGSEAMKTWRQAVADRINENCGTQWHGGTLADTGITDRPAKKRLPTALYKAREEVAGWHEEYAKDGDFLPEKTRRDSKARLRRIKLAQAAERVDRAQDERGLQEWLEAKRAREAEEKAAKVALQRADELQAVPAADTPNSVPAPPQEAAEPFRIDPTAPMRERQRITAGLSDADLVARYSATKAAHETAPPRSPEWFELKLGAQALGNEMMRRGLHRSPTTASRPRDQNEP